MLSTVSENPLLPNPHADPVALEPLDSSLEPMEKTRLSELAIEIRRRLHKFAEDIYRVGTCLMEAKEMFPRGQNQAFLEWAKLETGLEKSAVYGYLNAFKVFGEVLKACSQLIQIDSSALIMLAAVSVPEAARIEAIALIREGKSISYTLAKELIERYQPDRFEEHQALVQAWGTLLPPTEDAPLQLIDQHGTSYTFQNYRDLKKSFKTWETEAFEASVKDLKTLVAPHWKVRQRPNRQEPYRLELECLIPNTHQLLTAKNPRSAHDWWHKQGQAATERFLERQTAGIDRQDASIQTAEISQKTGIGEPIESVSCLTCGWNDPNYHELQSHELWCGFYRDPVSRDKAEILPDQCRKWYAADTDAYPFQHTPRLQNGKASAQSVALEQKQEGMMISAQPTGVEEGAGISDREFATMLGNVPKLTSVQLSQLEETIRYCKHSVSENG